MLKTAALLLALGSAAASTGLAQSAPVPAKQYRLTFVLEYPDGRHPSQTFVLDVPVTRDTPGMAGSSTIAGLVGKPESSVQQNLQCSDVKESPTGVAARVDFTIDSIAKPLPGATEPIHQNLTFVKQVDLALGKATRISEELHVRPLGRSDTTEEAIRPPAPTITVTAIEL